MPEVRPRLLPWLLLPLLAASAAGCGGRDAGSAEDGADVAVRVGTIALDPRANAPVVVLEEVEGARRLPIWIGVAEARSIASELEHEERVRPNTHDLAKRLVDRLEGAVERVVVTRLDEGIYYALITLHRRGERFRVDARPSDAIAIALRYGAPLFVREPLFEEGGEAEEEGREIRTRLRRAPQPEPASERQLPAERA